MARDSETLTELAAALAAAGGPPPAPAAAPPGRWPGRSAATVLRGFDEPDAAGVRRPGVVLRAPPLSLVRAPADATVRYAGPFLEYGYVVVLEPAPGTMVVLAGLAQLQARAGAAVRRGEPLGLLGGRPLDVEEYVMLPQSDTGAGGGETLYIEVRQGRGPVDPAAPVRRKGIGRAPMRNIWLAGIGGAVAGVVVSTQFAAPILAQEAEKEKSVYQQLDLFGDIFERIRTSYVEEVEDKELIESAINGMLTHLDPHSSYLPPDDFDDMRVQTKGEFGGLGIEVTQENGFVKVVTPIEGTPADRAGVQPGDLITQVDGESVLGLTLEEAVDLMRGPVGSDITVTLTREGTEEPFDVKITRETITISPVRARLEDGVVVLRLTTFNEQTYPELEEALKEQVEEAGGIDKVTGFVIDLRNNPGGLLNQAISVVDAFLESGEIVSTRGRDPRDSERYNATPGDLTDGKPLAVVINGGSASASEIVAGALKDHRRAVVIGTQSFGKGSVQTIMPVQDEGAIRLTTARYYTPSGRSIQALGVAPDIIVEQREPEEVAEAEESDAAAAADRGRPARLARERLADRGREEDPRGGQAAQGGDRAAARGGLSALLRDRHPARHVLPRGGERTN